jgi:hypothetical protein
MYNKGSRSWHNKYTMGQMCNIKSFNISMAAFVLTTLKELACMENFTRIYLRYCKFLL